MIKVASQNEQSLINKVNELTEFNQRATERVNELNEFNRKATETVNTLQSQVDQMEVSSIEEEIQEESENQNTRSSNGNEYWVFFSIFEFQNCFRSSVCSHIKT